MATKKETVETKKEETTMTLAEMQAEMKRMLDEAKAEAAKIVENAKASVASKRAISDETRAKRKAYMNEYVEVKLFKDNNKYKDDVFVSVNGETCQIKRGERVKIKRKFAAVLDRSDKQDYETALLIEKESGTEKFAGAI